MTRLLQKKIDNAIKIIRLAQKQAILIGASDVELSYSGDKDSDVILQLAKESGIKFRAIYKNTTIDPPGTIKHVLDNSVEIIRPKEPFFRLIEKNGFPRRHARFCCRVLKEYKVLDVSIQGIRRAESWKRAKLYREPQICRTYSAKEKVKVFLPILDWTNEDVREYIEERQIKCHSLYYDEKGNFDVNRRLGCLGCPMQSDNGLNNFKRYPGLVKAWLRAGRKFIDTHPQSNTSKKFRNEYELFAHNIFFNSYNEFKESISGLFGYMECKDFLENYFGIKL